MSKKYPLLNNQDLETLNQSLHYLGMADLKKICISLHLPDKGIKINLINRITSFVKTGIIIELAPIPVVSRAKKGGSYPLTPSTLMVYGDYKNDLKTRIFMKKLVGDYFHFTAFGIDWLKDRWHAGNPPTYAEFAKFWAHEYEARKQTPAQPKAEWAYINFVQRYIEKNPHAKKQEIMIAWNHARDENIKIVTTILKKL